MSVWGQRVSGAGAAAAVPSSVWQERHHPGTAAGVAPVDAAKCGIRPGNKKRAYARGTVAAGAAATLTAKGGGALPWRHDRSLDYYSRITYCK